MCMYQGAHATHWNQPIRCLSVPSALTLSSQYIPVGLVCCCFENLINMQYELSELRDMIMCYGEARGNGREARHIYEQQYSNRRHPHHTTFAAIHRHLGETGNLSPQTVGDVRTPDFEDAVVEQITDKPSTSTCAVAHAMNVSHQSIWRVLWEYNLHTYHLQRVQAIRPADCVPCMHFFQ